MSVKRKVLNLPTIDMHGAPADPFPIDSLKKSSQSNDKASSVIRQVRLYQDQLKIRLLLQQPLAIAEQLPTASTVHSFASVELDENDMPIVYTDFNLTTRANSTAQSDSDSLFPTTSSDSSSANQGKTNQLQYKRGVVRKFRLPDTTDDDSSTNDDVVDRYHRHTAVKRRCVAHALTSQTLNDLIQLDRRLTVSPSHQKISSHQYVDDDVYEELIETNPLLQGLTAKARYSMLTQHHNEEEESNVTISPEELTFREQYEKIDQYLGLLWDGSESQRNKVVDKWDKRVQRSLNTGSGGDAAMSNLQNLALDSLNLKLSEQIHRLIHAENPRLVQRSRLRRVHKLSLGQLSYDELADTSDLELLQHYKKQQRFDVDIYDDQDLSAILFKDITDVTLLNNSAFAEHEAIKRQIRSVKLSDKYGVDSLKNRKKQVKYDVIPRLANFMVPISNANWIRATALDDVDEHGNPIMDDGNADTIAATRKSDELLGAMTTESELIDQLLHNLFGQHHRKEQGARYQPQQSQKTSSGSNGYQGDDDDDDGYDADDSNDDAYGDFHHQDSASDNDDNDQDYDDEDDQDYDDDDDDDHASWFK